MLKCLYLSANHNEYIMRVNLFFWGLLSLIVGVNPALAQPNPEKTKLIFWHSMAGNLATAVNTIAEKFNQSQQEFELKPIYKGGYNEVLTTTVAAFRAKQQPHLIQLFEIGTASVINPAGIVVPVASLMQKANVSFDTGILLPALARYYSDENGRLLAMPFNSSSAVMFYNKDAFRKAGLDSEKPPKTWPEIEKTARKLRQAGYPCGFTTAYPSWTQLENFSAWHNVSLASLDNGFGGAAARVDFTHPIIEHHVQTFREWQKDNLFQYGGRSDNATSLFTSGHCPILFQSSGALMSYMQSVQFSLGTTSLPYWPQVKGAPQNTLMGGAALWALEGHSKNEYQGIAKFLAFLTTTDIQVFWQAATGYLPLTHAAYQQSLQQDFYQQYPGALVAIQTLRNKPATSNSQGIRLGYYPQIREITDEALEASWSGTKTTKEALKDATQRANELLRRFQQNSEIK